MRYERHGRGSISRVPRGIPGLLVNNRVRMEGFLVFDFLDRYDEGRRQIREWCPAQANIGSVRPQASVPGHPTLWGKNIRSRVAVRMAVQRTGKNAASTCELTSSLWLLESWWCALGTPDRRIKSWDEKAGLFAQDWHVACRLSGSTRVGPSRKETGMANRSAAGTAMGWPRTRASLRTGLAVASS